VYITQQDAPHEDKTLDHFDSWQDIRITKSRRICLAGNVASLGEKISA
jgi:hypothetical protein